MADRRRRPNGGGSISTRKTDRALTAQATDPNTGKRPKRIVHRKPGETQAQHRRRAEQVLADLITELNAPAELRESWTVEQWATERYLPSIGHLSPATRSSYRMVLTTWVSPFLGHIRLADLTAEHVDDLDRVHLAGKSMATRRHARGALSRLLRHARRKGRVTQVATDLADRLVPDPPRPAKPVLEPNEVRAILGNVDDDLVELPIALMATLGLRRGETLGLAWSRVDLDDGRIFIDRNLVVVDNESVLGSPKTAGSRRTLDLAPNMIALLRTHRARQAADRLSSGELWADPMVDANNEPVDLVCVDEVGRPLTPARVAGALRRAGERAGVGHVTPHALRHAAASSMIAAGMDVAAVSGVMGHANPSVTLGTYSHAFGERRTAATGSIAEAIGEW